jgi:hypothetical protein
VGREGREGRERRQGCVVRGLGSAQEAFSKGFGYCIVNRSFYRWEGFKAGESAPEASGPTP